MIYVPPLFVAKSILEAMEVELDFVGCIWFLSTLQEPHGFTGLIKKIISACQSKTMSLADTIIVMAQRAAFGSSYEDGKTIFSLQVQRMAITSHAFKKSFLVIDKRLLLLRYGRKLMGILRFFDQFANVVFEGACDRVIIGDLYCDIPLGLYVIRGKNVVLISELDLEKEELPLHMVGVSVEEIKREPCDVF